MEQETASGSRTILVVEDEPEMQRLLKERMDQDGHTVVTASGVNEAYAALKQQPVDLVLLDLRLSDGLGTDLLGLIRGDPALADEAIAVVVLTNVDDVGMVARVFSEGLHDYLVKADHTLDSIAEHVKKKLRMVPPRSPVGPPAPKPSS